MTTMPCNFQKLVQLLDNELDIDAKLEVLNHVDACTICRDAVFQISRDRDEALYWQSPYPGAGFMDQEAPLYERFCG